MFHPRRPLFVALALAGAIAAGSLALSGVPAPALSLGWYGDACDDATAQNPGDLAGCRYDARESDCGNGIDDDSDEAADGADADCGACSPRVEDCGNGADEDCDGLADCADADCGSDPRCSGCPEFSVFDPSSWFCVPVPETCGNGIDDDGDALADCADSDCAADPSCAVCTGTSYCDPGCPEYHLCACDPSADGCRLDCPVGYAPAFRDGVYSCYPLPPEICNNGIDDDGDGYPDCQDSADCASSPTCQRCTGTNVCDSSCPEYNLCVCDPSSPSCGGGCTGSFCECNPSAPSCTGGSCGNGSCVGGETCETCEEDCGKCPPPPELCGNGIDDDEDGRVDCQDTECSSTCECTNTCGVTTTCNDQTACNYGEEGGCEYCSCDGLDNDDDGETDEEGETCDPAPAGGCSDPGATNYDPEATTGEDRDESCSYEYGCVATVDGPIVSSFGGALAALYAPWNLLAADPSNVSGGEFLFRFSISRQKGGGWNFSLSPQVALVTNDGRYPMGAIQAGPSVTLSGTGLAPTPPYSTDDPIQKKIHQEIDKGFFGKWMAEKHTQLQKKCDVYNWFNRK